MAWRKDFSLILGLCFLSQVVFAKPVKESKPAVKIKTQVVRTKTAQVARQPKITSSIISASYIDGALKQAAIKADVPYELLRAICQTESNLKHDAFVFNDGGSGNHSYGMCQVLHFTAKNYIDVEAGCAQDFRDPSLARSPKACSLFGPKTNALVAAQYLKAQIDRYKGDLVKATAAYNAGSYLTCTKGKVKTSTGRALYTCVPGDVLNRHYINRVEDFMGGAKLCSSELAKERSVYDVKNIPLNQAMAKGQI